MPSIDYDNSFLFSQDNKVFTQIQDNIVNINSTINKFYIKIKTNKRDDTVYYGDKILILKIKEIVLYDSSENPYFIFNDIGIGKIREWRQPPTVYSLNVSNPNVYRGSDVVFELSLDKVISKFGFEYSISNLTAISGLDYNNVNLKYSNNNGSSWIDLTYTNNILTFTNTDKILLKVPTILTSTDYRGDRVFLFSINKILYAPENCIVNIVNSISYATIRDSFLPTVQAHLRVNDSFCDEGQSLVFETELVLKDSDINLLTNNDQIIVYYNVSNITAYTGIDYSEVMYWSYDKVNYIQTSSRQVIYTKSNLKVYIKIETINSAAQEYNYNVKRSLLLKPELIIKNPNFLNININDVGIGVINNISIPFDYYTLSINDAITKEGDYIIFDILSNKALKSSIVLNLQLSDLTAVNNKDYYNILQYSINQGSTYINASFNNIIFHKGLSNIKIRIQTIKSSEYIGNRSFLIKIKSIIEKPFNYIIDYQDMAIGTIEDLSEPPVNYSITFLEKDYSVIQGSDFIFRGYIYPPLRYDGLELKLQVIPENNTSQNNSIASNGIDYDLQHASISTNNGLSWSLISRDNTIILNKDNSFFDIKLPTYKNLSKPNSKNIKFLIEKVFSNTPNSNIDISKSFIITTIK